MQNARFVTDFFFCFFQLPDVVVDFTKGGGCADNPLFFRIEEISCCLKKKVDCQHTPPLTKNA